MAGKLADLQTALNSSRALAAPPERPQNRASAAPVSKARQADRIQKVNVAAWMHPDFKRSLRLVQARRPGTIQDLLEEALNDLFAKYDVPQVATEQGNN